MRSLTLSLLCVSLAAGCLPSRRIQQPTPAAVQPTAPPPNYGPPPGQWQNPQPQPYPQGQPGQPGQAGQAGQPAQPGMVIPGMMGLPPVTLPWPVTPPAGGGGQAGQPSTFPFPLPFPFPAPATAPVDPNWPAAWARLEDEVLLEVNARRATGANCGGRQFGPAAPVVSVATLRQAARMHSRDMATRDYFDHTSPEGRQVGDRLRAAGYGGGFFGENIAAGNATARETVDQWMTSPGHCSNVMEPGFRSLGVGYAFAQNNRFGHYWTQDFGG